MNSNTFEPLHLFPAPPDPESDEYWDNLVLLSQSTSGMEQEALFELNGELVETWSEHIDAVKAEKTREKKFKQTIKNLPKENNVKKQPSKNELEPKEDCSKFDTFFAHKEDSGLEISDARGGQDIREHDGSRDNSDGGTDEEQDDFFGTTGSKADTTVLKDRSSVYWSEAGAWIQKNRPEHFEKIQKILLKQLNLAGAVGSPADRLIITKIAFDVLVQLIDQPNFGKSKPSKFSSILLNSAQVKNWSKHHSRHVSFSCSYTDVSSSTLGAMQAFMNMGIIRRETRHTKGYNCATYSVIPSPGTLLIIQALQEHRFEVSDPSNGQKVTSRYSQNLKVNRAIWSNTFEENLSICPRWSIHDQNSIDYTKMKCRTLPGEGAIAEVELIYTAGDIEGGRVYNQIQNLTHMAQHLLFKNTNQVNIDIYKSFLQGLAKRAEDKGKLDSLKVIREVQAKADSLKGTAAGLFLKLMINAIHYGASVPKDCCSYMKVREEEPAMSRKNIYGNGQKERVARTAFDALYAAVEKEELGYERDANKSNGISEGYAIDKKDLKDWTELEEVEHYQEDGSYILGFWGRYHRRALERTFLIINGLISVLSKYLAAVVDIFSDYNALGYNDQKYMKRSYFEKTEQAVMELIREGTVANYHDGAIVDLKYFVANEERIYSLGFVVKAYGDNELVRESIVEGVCVRF